MASNFDLYVDLSTKCSKDALHGSRKYIPVHVMNDLFTKDSIKAELGSKKWFAWGGGSLADEVMKMNARRLFAILVYIDKPWDIKELLMDGLTDEHLPLTKQGEEPHIDRIDAGEELQVDHGSAEEELQVDHSITRIFNPPNSWDHRTVDLFFESQWKFLAPVFNTSGEHLRLDARCPLPILSSLRVGALTTGSVVYDAEVEASHQIWFEESEVPASAAQKTDVPSVHVALKQFLLMKDFEKERGNLKMIRRLTKNKHIIQNLATFSQKETGYIIFPFAEGGDLDNFWTKSDSKPRTPQLALWCLQQMLGLAEALEALHTGIDEKSHCRHGDLKPENILHFPTDGEGILKIADFGISKIHHQATLERNDDPTVTRATTPSYEAPEAADDPEKQKARSRKYDLWSLGCIFLEFTIWLVRGRGAVHDFATARAQIINGHKTSLFYQKTNGDPAIVHPEITTIIDELNELTQSTEGTALGDLLSIIETDLLVVNVAARIDAAELCSRLGSIVKKAESDPIYLFNNKTSVSLS